MIMIMICSTMSCRTLYLCMALSVLMVQVSPQELTSTLHSTFYGLKFAYDGERVNFTCVTRGSYSIAWTSDEYIGSDGNRLEFISIDPEGTTQSVGQTVAMLVNASDIKGQIILKSQLQIFVRSTFQVSSITCHSLGSEAVNTISFGTAGNTSIACDKLAVCPGETVTCTCITGFSNTLAWSSDELIGTNDARLEFVSIDPVATRHNVTGSSTFAVLTGVSSLNGVVVLSSDLTFVASGSPANILTCLNVGRQSSYSIIIPKSRSCMAVSTNFTSTDTNTYSMTTTPGPGEIGSDKSILAVGISLIIVATVVAVFFILIIVVLRKAYRKGNEDLQTSLHSCVGNEESPAPLRLSLDRIEMDSEVQRQSSALKRQESTDSGNYSRGTYSEEQTPRLERFNYNTMIIRQSTMAPLEEQLENRCTDREEVFLNDEKVCVCGNCSDKTESVKQTEQMKSSRQVLPETNKRLTSDSGATAIQHDTVQLSGEKCRGPDDDNVIRSGDHWMELIAKMQSEKERKIVIVKKNVEGVLEDVFLNNLDDMNNASGKSDADADKSRCCKED